MYERVKADLREKLLDAIDDVSQNHGVIIVCHISKIEIRKPIDRPEKIVNELFLKLNIKVREGDE